MLRIILTPSTCRIARRRKFTTVTSTQLSQSTFDTDYHAPVMWKECVEALLGCQRYQDRITKNSTITRSTTTDHQVQEPIVFVDGTLGGGGHSEALLQHLEPGDVVIGCDVDSDALETASQRLSNHLANKNVNNTSRVPLFVPVQSNFAQLTNVLPNLRHPMTQQPLLPNGTVDGILLDLGVSSYQIDTAERGFAFMKDGPLDMRMDRNANKSINHNCSNSLTAADLCNELDQVELQRILKQYGDEPRARAIAQSIVQQRPLATTQDLVRAVAAVTPEYAKQKRMGRTASLARVFQSFRIVVNQEDKVLQEALSVMCPTLLRPGGRLAVLSYHSMEDRATKRIMRDGTLHPTPETYEKDIYGNLLGPPRPFKPLSSKARSARAAEVKLNKRARSAKLRVADRCDT